jgi:ParB family chromosome partitioning protein
MTAGNQPAKNAAKKRGLGRGLEALLGPKAAAEAPPLQAMPGDTLRTLPVDAMVPGKYQPRRSMDEAKLEELASSIRSQGVIQPIVVREQLGADGKGGRTYEIIAGERRWRASQRAGLAEVPVVVRVVDDRTVVAMALIENIQREDLNPLEEAQALQRLIDEFDLTHAAAAEAVGRSRAAVSNLLRLLELPAEIRALVQAGAIEMGHARALLPLAAPMAISLAKQAAEHGWSVREVEHRVQQLSSGKVGTSPKKPATRTRPQADIVALERELSESLGSRVDVVQGRGKKGKLVIHYADFDVLDGVLERLRNKA